MMGLSALLFTSCMQQNKEMDLLVGSYNEASASGISLYRLNTETGKATLKGTVSGIPNPSFQVVSHDGRFVYSVSEMPEPEAALYAYQRDPTTGSLTLLNKQPTEGSAPCNVWVDSRRRLVVTANYNGGSISAFPVAADGSLLPPTVYAFEGGTPGSPRQSAPYLHCVYASPDEKYLFANDLGTDRIYKFELLPSPGGLSLRAGNPAYFSLPQGEGPRHSVFHPNGKWVYLIGELSGRVTCFDYSSGNLEAIQSVEADTLHAAGSADIHITPDGRFLYASNRLEGDGLAIFAIDQATGRLSKVGYQPTARHPRNFVITPNGRYLLVACRNSHLIQCFAIDAASGLLTPAGEDLHTHEPVCLTLIHE